MSIIFGIRYCDERVIDESQLRKLAQATDRHAPDGTFVRANGSVGMGFQPYHTHERSILELQPTIDVHGNMVVLDGRLDNHIDLCQALGLPVHTISDSSIVLAAFLSCGELCFSKFIGDWALALWSHQDRALYLARDHAGTRTLYFSTMNGLTHWSTHLETFFPNEALRELDPTYAACYLTFQPLRQLTPYKDISAIPPAQYVKFRDGRITHHPHWHWTNKGRIHYKTESEYEEHFLALFRQSVDRRTGRGAPLLAHLSGGMDSSSIVCMSDHIRQAQGSFAPADFVDTLSMYDDSEPTWNERPYFSVVEGKRGKEGIHISRSLSERTFGLPDPQYGPYLLPGVSDSGLRHELLTASIAQSKGYRVILAGYGGDELLGGVPTPIPELGDHLLSARLPSLLRSAVSWSLATHVPLHQLLSSTVKDISAAYWSPKRLSLPPWIPNFLSVLIRKHAATALHARRRELKYPSILIRESAWSSILETLPHLLPGHVVRLEYRYPYLDRDLVDFVAGVPMQFLLRPRRRRALMRQALRHIVPSEILERRRKAFISRGPLLSLDTQAQAILEVLRNSWLAKHGLVDSDRLLDAARHITNGRDQQSWPNLVRAVHLEMWLSLNAGRIAEIGITTLPDRPPTSRLVPKHLPAG